MARFDIYRPLRGEDGLLLDIQAGVMDHLSSRIVVPLLLPASAPRPARILNPTFQIDGQEYVMVTQFMSAVSARELARQVGNLSACQDQIVAAVDLLLQGF